MIDQETLFFIIPVIIVIATFYFSRFCLRKYPKFTGEELAKLNPEYSSIKFTYNAIQTVIALVPLLFLVVVSSFYDKSDMRILFLGLPVFLALTLYDGLFALITGI